MWLKIMLPTVLSAVVVTLLLMVSGLGTISLIDLNNEIVTKTVVALEINTFAVVMIAGVALTVLFTGLIVNSTDKPVPAQVEAPTLTEPAQPEN